MLGSPPRLRGFLGDGLDYFGSQGSPPRLRGFHREHLVHYGPQRLTTASAGLPFLPPLKHLLRQAHRRACGVSENLARKELCAIGSPPRLRGFPLAYSDGARCSGAHRRVCGVSTGACMTGTTRSGSPPRLRGFLIIHYVNVCQYRLTAASAGFPPSGAGCR